jgi:MarR family 2-MHQ and catechol resistance regulon transcriptional repressor
MSTFAHRLADLRELVVDIICQMQFVDEVAATGPHLELKVQELQIIEHLGDRGPKMMKELAEMLRLAVNSITTIVDSLEKRELVRRVRSEEDRRVVKVELTPHGAKAYQGVANERDQLLKGMLKALTEDEQEIFLILFRKIARAGRSQVQKLTGQG